MPQPGGDEPTVVIGKVCWSLNGDSIGEIIKLTPYDAYQALSSEERRKRGKEFS